MNIKKILIIIILVGCFTVKASLNNAQNIYADKYKNIEQGVYIDDDIVFVVVVIKDKLKNNLYEATGMLRSKSLIVNYIENKKLPSNKFKLVESQYLSDVIAERENIHSFSIKNLRVLDNRKDKNVYRYVIAFTKNELEILGKKISSTDNRSKRNISIIRDMKQSYYDNEDTENIRKILLEIGSIEPLIALMNSEIVYEYNIEIFLAIKDYIALLQKIEKVNQLISEGILEKQTGISEVLSLCPGNYKALKALKSFFKKNNNPVSEQIINLTLKAYSLETKLEFDGINALTSNKTALNEYEKLLSTLEAYLQKNQKSKSIAEKYVRRTLGHVNFGEHCNKSSNRYLEEAKRLFDEKRDLEKVISSLYVSTQISPANMDAWHYLGKAMQSQRKFELSVIYLNQALLLSPQNVSVKVDLSLTYNYLHFNNLAKGIALDALTDDKKLSPKEKNICMALLKK